jgi:two-component system, LytTR family, response regulator
MTITCGIIEDELLGRKLLERYISRVPELKLVWTKESVEELTGMDKTPEFFADIIFLDLFSPDVLNVTPSPNFDKCKPIEEFAHIILTTAFPFQFIKPLSFNYVAILNKPILFSRFMAAVTDAIESIKKNKEII